MDELEKMSCQFKINKLALLFLGNDEYLKSAVTIGNVFGYDRSVLLKLTFTK